MFSERQGIGLAGVEMPNGQSTSIRCQSGNARYSAKNGENFSILWISNRLDYD